MSPRAGFQKTALKEIRAIYRRLAELNRKRQGSVEGFGELMPTLDTESDEELVVHAVDTEKEAFTIFTNVPTTRLIGLFSLIPSEIVSSCKTTPHPRR